VWTLRAGLNVMDKRNIYCFYEDENCSLAAIVNDYTTIKCPYNYGLSYMTSTIKRIHMSHYSLLLYGLGIES